MTAASDKSLKTLDSALTLGGRHGSLEKRGFMRRFSSFLCFVLVVVLAGSVIAQDNAVNIAGRVGVQDGFIRVVLNGTGLPTAQVTETDASTLRVQFAQAVNLTGVEGGDISPTVTIAKEGDNTLVIKSGPMSRHRTLALGNRLFVDLFTTEAPSGSAAPASAAPAPAENAATVPAPEAAETPAAAPASLVKDDGSAPKPLEAAPPLKEAEVADVKTALPEAPEAAPAAKLPGNAGDAPVAVAAPVTTPAAVPGEYPREYKGSAVVTIGSTQGVALAAFIREGHLWVVLSQESLSVPPLVSGPNAADLGPVDAVKIDGGSAYRMKMPDGAYVRPEGAGLVWRLYIEGKKPILKSVTADRDFANTAEGPQVHIPLTNAISALRVPDPLMGDDLAVITVGRADARLINSDKYVDFDLMPAIVGAVIRPKADGIRIAVLPTEVVISRQGGLRLSAAGPRPARSAVTEDAPAAEGQAPAAAKLPAPSAMFAFDTWAMGGPKNFLAMRRSIDEKVASAPEDGKLPELIAGAKFMLAQGLPQEANGFLQMALSYLPVLRDAAEFQAINGATLALMGDTDAALKSLNTPGLENNDEIAMWKSYALTRAGNVTEAQKTAPKNIMALVGKYPDRLQTMVLPALIEAQLARGDVGLANQMVDAYTAASDNSFENDRASAIAYFRGRIAQLRGDNGAAIESFRVAAEGRQGPYPVRATLALVERGLSAKTINREDAVRKLERFRYGWRGDGLESEMLQRLGMIYVTGGEQRRGLTILRDAATMASSDEDREKLVAVMQKAFRELFSGKTREKMTPIESAAIAAEFAELMPAGGEGEAITMTIADQMVAVDLLDRAANMIEPMVERTETLPNAIRYAERAAAIRILNDQPQDALKIINKALSRPDAEGKTMTAAQAKSIGLLRAKAKAELKQPDAALSELHALPEDSETLRLTADIAWGASRWPLAADAFGKLVRLANLNATRPPSREEAQMVLNQALALNLAGETDELEQLRLGYSDIMRRSEFAQPFSVVTRTAREASLADRETLLKLVSEVNMFKEVLDTYKEDPAASKPAAQTGEAGNAAKPAAETPAAAPKTN